MKRLRSDYLVRELKQVITRITPENHEKIKIISATTNVSIAGILTDIIDECASQRIDEMYNEALGKLPISEA